MKRAIIPSVTVVLAIVISASWLLPPVTSQSQSIVRDLARQLADVTVFGADSGDNLGRTVATGDINGDGIADMIVGVWGPNTPGASPIGGAGPDNNRPGAGEVRVILGNTRLGGTRDLAGLPTDLTIYGRAGSQLGQSIAVADLNGDSVADLIIGAAGRVGPSGQTLAGEVRVFFGGPDLVGERDLATQSANINIFGSDSTPGLGSAVAVGDVNGDRVKDLIVSAPLSSAVSPNSKLLIFFGGPTLAGTIDLRNAAPDVTISSNLIDDGLGSSLAIADINRDGLDDIIAGRPLFNRPGATGAQSGQVAVIFGRQMFPALQDLGSRPPDFIIIGARGGDRLGSSVVSADVNADSIPDILANNVVVFGAKTLSGTLDLARNHADFAIVPAADEFKQGVSVAAGDVNGDAVADIVLGAPGAADPDRGRAENTGKVFIIFGSQSLPELRDLSIDPADVTIIGSAPGALGSSIAVGDVNRDAVADVIVGAPLFAGPDGTRASSGATYVLFGGRFFSIDVISPAGGELVEAGAPFTLRWRTAPEFGAVFHRLQLSVNDGESFSTTIAIVPDNIQEFVWDVPSGLAARNARVLIVARNMKGERADTISPSFTISPIPRISSVEFVAGATPRLRVSGSGFLTDNAVVEINGAVVGSMRFPLPFNLPDGTSTRIDAAGQQLFQALPVNTQVRITVLNRLTNVRSEPFRFTRLQTVQPSSTQDLASQPANLAVVGADAQDELGQAVFTGDINGDRVSDLILGARAGRGPNNNRSAAGEVRVFFGNANLSGVRDLAGQQPDLTVFGAAGSQLGLAIAVGDVNGDGIGDLILGAPTSSALSGQTFDVGEVRIYFGGPNLRGTRDLAGTNADVNIFGGPLRGLFGSSLAVGDVNGDGVKDVIIGSPAGASDSSKVLVFFGGSGLRGSIDMRGRSANFTLLSAALGEALGASVASADVNADGIDDIIAGAPQADAPGRTDPGKVYVIFGKRNLGGLLNLASQSADVTIIGERANDLLGKSLAAADVNGNGIADIIIGAPDGGAGAPGSVIIISGNINLAGARDLSAQPADASIIGVDAGDRFGASIAAADFNEDNVADIVVGAPDGKGPGNSRSGAGEAYVIFGGADLSIRRELANTPAEVTIFGPAGGEQFGSSVHIGDVNDDGGADLVLGAPRSNTSTGGRAAAGAAYVVFSRVTNVIVSSPTGAETIQGGSDFKITWRVPASFTPVKQTIKLSTDGGATFPIAIVKKLLGDVREFIWQLPADLQTDTGKIQVSATDAQGNKLKGRSAGNFRIIPAAPLVCTGLSPQELPANNAATITITGSGFTSDARVVITNSSSGATVTLIPTVAPTSLTVSIDAATLNVPSGTGFAVTVTQGSRSCSPGSFRVVTSSGAPFSCTGLSPQEVVANSDATISITGTGFNSTAVVQINGSAAGITTSFVNQTTLNATIAAAVLNVPDGASLTVTVVQGGSSCSPGTLRVRVDSGAPFFCTGFSPATVIANAPATLTISGSGFNSNARVTLTNLTSGVSKTFIPTVSLNSLTVAIDGATLTPPSSNAKITVVQGSNTCEPGNIRIQVPIPTIGAVSPASVIAGDGPQTLTITTIGNDNSYSSILNVLFDDIFLGGTGFVDHNTASAVLEAHLFTVPGQHSIKVRNQGDGGPKDSAPFAYSVVEGTPEFRSLSPDSVNFNVGAQSGLNINIVATKAHNLNGGLRIVLKKNGTGSEFVFTPSSFNSSGGIQNIRVNIPNTFFTAGLTSITVQIRNPGGATSAARTIAVNP